MLKVVTALFGCRNGRSSVAPIVYTADTQGWAAVIDGR